MDHRLPFALLVALASIYASPAPIEAVAQAMPILIAEAVDGTYKGSLTATGTCFAPWAELTVVIKGASANGNWYFEKQKITAEFSGGEANANGFTAARTSRTGEEQSIKGTFVDGAAAMEAQVVGGGCTYSGKIKRG
jgi:hypothetical protein